MDKNIFGMFLVDIIIETDKINECYNNTNQDLDFNDDGNFFETLSIQN